jgi:hypothetical protein
MVGAQWKNCNFNTTARMIQIKYSTSILGFAKRFDFFDLRQFNKMHPKHKICLSNGAIPCRTNL